MDTTAGTTTAMEDTEVTEDSEFHTFSSIQIRNIKRNFLLTLFSGLPGSEFGGGGFGSPYGGINGGNYGYQSGYGNSYGYNSGYGGGGYGGGLGGYGGGLGGGYGGGLGGGYGGGYGGGLGGGYGGGYGGLYWAKNRLNSRRLILYPQFSHSKPN